jgi:hypothetical protein
MKNPRSLRLAVLVAATMACAPAFAAGEAAKPADTRTALKLNAGESAFVRTEMRDFLAAVQTIVAALERGDYKAVAVAARRVGMSTMMHVPPALRAKFPQQWRDLGHSLHQDFDLMALDAETVEDRQHTLKQLGEAMSKCVACHAIYRLGP